MADQLAELESAGDDRETPEIYGKLISGNSMFDHTLDEAEARTLGALLEKELSTPEYYPLSLKALTAACNQKSNREPVVSFDEATVVRALDGLKEKRLVRQSDASRVPRYEEIFVRHCNLLVREAALLCLLLLRGGQTLGELRGRSERLHAFSSLEEVGEVLENLVDLGLVKKMARLPGHKECRYVQLLGGEVAELPGGSQEPRPEAATLRVRAEGERLAALEEEVRLLRDELREVRQALRDFQTQFE